MDTDEIRKTTLWARGLLTQEIGDLLIQVYGLKADGSFIPIGDVPAQNKSAEVQENRRRLEKLIDDEKDAGTQPVAAVTKLIKEVAFTHLNRLVALKLLESPRPPDNQRLIRDAIGRYHNSNGFLRWLPDHPADYQLYELGTTPLDEVDESPRDRAYRHFLLWQYGELAKEVRVLFDPESLASQLFPRPKVLRQIIEQLNSEELKEAWQPGNEETIGWIYQYFNEPDLEIFRGQNAPKVPPHLVGPKTQNFTPRWVVRFLVENSLGRLWLEIHPDSRLAERLHYLVPLPANRRTLRIRPVSEITFLDPATGTMHFGLVAFDLFADMYREELENQGNDGWPQQASVGSPEDIPSAIVRNNLFGIDVDLRAVQLAALVLYVRSKTLNSKASLPEPNLACADVTYLTPKVLDSYLEDAGFMRPVYSRVLKGVFSHLQNSAQTGSLLRLEQEIQSLIEEERRAATKDSSLFPDVKRFRDALAGNEAFWDFLNVQIQHSLDEIARRFTKAGQSTFYADQVVRSLKLSELLMKRYDVVATNPPYLDSRDYNPTLKSFVNAKYSDANRNLYAAMMRRSLELVQPDGRLAMIAGQSFMFITSFLKLREYCLNNIAIETLAQFDYGLFAARVDTAAFILGRESDETARLDSVGVYFRLVKEPDAEAKRVTFEHALQRRKHGEADPRVYEYRQGDFAAIAGSPWVYWITPRLRALFQNLPKLEDIAEPRQGLATADNFRFLRFWWEIGSRRIGFRCKDTDESARRPERWYPYMKGGSFLRWYGNQEYIINYGQNGYEIKAWADPLYGNSGWSRIIKSPDFYFRRGVTWTDLTAGRFSARLSPGGFIFDVKGSSAFPDDIPLILGLLNSSFANYALNLINPTVSYQVGDLSRLPVPKQSSGALRGFVDRAIARAKADSEEDETTYDFIAPPPWPGGIETVSQRHKELTELEGEIDEEVYRLYEISDEDRKAIEAELAAPLANAETNENGESGNDQTETETAEEGPLTQNELAVCWIGYAVGVALGRFQPGVEGALGCGSFAPEVAAKVRDLADRDGVMILEEGHPDDLARRVLDILTVIYGDAETEQIVRTASESTASLRNALETYLLSEFFKDHVKRYRKRPIYWLLQSSKKSYNVYLFHERATADTLSLLRGNRYLGGRLNRLQQDQAARMKAAEVANRAGDRRAASQAQRDASQIAELLEELQEFDRRLEAATRVPIKDKTGRDTTARWEPELDDSVYINAAPLHELLPSWREVNLKKAWQELANGDYDWSKTAMRYWPRRVLEKCKKNKSYAIAHGLL
jgi:N-6 DNA Methylase